MSVQQWAAGGAPVAHPYSATSLPAFPDSALPQQQRAVYEADGGLPLPVHFPQPYTASPHHQQAVPSSIVPGASPKMVQCPTKQVVKNHMQDIDDRYRDPDEAKEGLRRITDKYAAPSMLYVNGSVCASDADTPSLSPVDAWPASTSPSSNQSVSPTPSGFSLSPVADGRPFTDPNSTPKSSGCVQNSAAKQNGSAHRLAPLTIPAFSDASSDMSDASPSPAFTGSVRSGSVSGRGGMLGVGSGRYQSVSGIALSTSLGDGVTDEDMQQVEMFYRSHKTEVTVCHSLANLYFGSVTTTTTTSPPGSTANGRLSPASVGDLWEFVTTGIPVLVLDSGDHHRARQLTIIVAEKGTGFVLWKDVVSHLTSYACPHANFHTLRISSDSNKLAGLSFDDSKAAAGFAAAMLKLTSDPEDELLMLSKKGKKKKKKRQDSKKKLKFKPPKKTDISQPCCFQHVTKLERPQVTGLTPLPPNGFPPAPGGSVSSLTDVFQDRLTVSVSRGRSPSSERSDASADH